MAPPSPDAIILHSEREVKNENPSEIGSYDAKLIQDEFDNQTYLFTYYRYMDKFHVEPRDWESLFEFLSYSDIDSKINTSINQLRESNG